MRLKQYLSSNRKTVVTEIKTLVVIIGFTLVGTAIFLAIMAGLLMLLFRSLNWRTLPDYSQEFSISNQTGQEINVYAARYSAHLHLQPSDMFPSRDCEPCRVRPTATRHGIIASANGSRDFHFLAYDADTNEVLFSEIFTEDALTSAGWNLVVTDIRLPSSATH